MPNGRAQQHIDASTMLSIDPEPFGRELKAERLGGRVDTLWVRLQQLVGLLLQWFFEEMNIINPDGTLAIDNDVQSNLFGPLSWL